MTQQLPGGSDRPALSIQQPWAWAILFAGKDVENRTWSTDYRGWILIHAGKRIDKEAIPYLREEFGVEVPPVERLQVGGIVGAVFLKDVIRYSDSDWAAVGQYHWLLEFARPMEFKPCRGRLGLFVPEVSG